MSHVAHTHATRAHLIHVVAMIDLYVTVGALTVKTNLNEARTCHVRSDAHFEELAAL